MSTNISKHISFPPALLEKIELNASAFGVSLAEYLRHLAINDSIKNEATRRKEWEDSLPVYTTSKEKWKEWDQAKNEEGVIMTSKELSKYLKNV